MKRLIWYYEDRRWYRHSFVVAETEPQGFFIAEKNDMGVVWYQVEGKSLAGKVKVEHNGTVKLRGEELKFHEIKTSVALSEVKKVSMAYRRFTLLYWNCNRFARDMLMSQASISDASELATKRFRSAFIFYA